jgi:hypothetical protein
MVFVSAAGARFEKGRACWTASSVKVGGKLSYTVVARLDLGTGVGTSCNTATVTADNAAPMTARACVDTHPMRARVTGGTVGVTG